MLTLPIVGLRSGSSGKWRKERARPTSCGTPCDTIIGRCGKYVGVGFDPLLHQGLMDTL